MSMFGSSIFHVDRVHQYSCHPTLVREGKTMEHCQIVISPHQFTTTWWRLTTLCLIVIEVRFGDDSNDVMMEIWAPWGLVWGSQHLHDLLLRGVFISSLFSVGIFGILDQYCEDICIWTLFLSKSRCATIIHLFCSGVLNIQKLLGVCKGMKESQVMLISLVVSYHRTGFLCHLKVVWTTRWKSALDIWQLSSSL